MTGRFDTGVPADFLRPTQLPATEVQSQQWQSANQRWWENHPMRYDWSKEVPGEELTDEFFAEIDRRFFGEAARFMPFHNQPFDELIPYSWLADKDVLEIGVGNGSHAQLLAKAARSFVGIDITGYAVRSTRARLSRLDLGQCDVRQMDAEELDFPDASFDFIWSWGVIHHSADTRRALGELQRVLRPGGHAVTMVYHRSLWSYYVVHGLVNGVVRGDLWRSRSLAKVVQRRTDGALARYYSRSEWRALMSEFFPDPELRVYGSLANLLPLPGGALKDKVMNAVPLPAVRLLTNRLALGEFLVALVGPAPVR